MMSTLTDMFNQLLIREAINPIVDLYIQWKKQPQSSPLMLTKEKENISFGRDTK
jgi:hypothetical protein